MAFGARELRLVLSIQSYGTGNISRLRRDIMALSRTTEMANRKAVLEAKLAQQATRMQDLNRQNKLLRDGVGLMNAKTLATEKLARGGSAIQRTEASQIRNARMLFDVETKRQVLTEKVRKMKSTYGVSGTDIALAERGFASLAMMEDELNLNAKALNTTLDIQRSELKRLEGAYAELVAVGKRDTAAITENRNARALQTAQIRETEAALAQLNAQQRMAPTQRAEIRARTGAHVARTAQFAGLIGTAVLGAAASQFAEFNKQTILAATQLRRIDRPMQDVAMLGTAMADGIHEGGLAIDGILDQMRQFPATGEEMSQATYDIFSSMDVNFGQGMKLLKNFNQLAVATGSDLATATDAGITVMNNFGSSTQNVSKNLNLMMTIIRYGRMRLADLNAMLEKVAPAATASGQSLENVAGAMVAITRLQPSQRVGATGIARLLQTFRDPDFQKGVFKISKGVADITEGAGATGKLKPLNEIIKTMAISFGLFEKQGGPSQLFKELTALGHGSGVGRQSRIEATNAYTFLVGHVQQYLRLQGKATKDTKEFGNALRAMSESPGVRWALFINTMRAFVLTIGEAAIPVLLGFAQWLAKIADWFSNLDKGARRLVIGAAAVISLFALFGGTIGSFAFSIAAAILSMKAMRLATIAAGDEATVAAGKFAFLGTMMKGLMGVGIIAIPIVLQILKGGDPGLWDFLGAATAGAVGGAMLGSLIGGPGVGTAAGAAVGAITVPIVIKLISMFQDEPNKEDKIRAAYEDYRKKLSDAAPGGGMWATIKRHALHQGPRDIGAMTFEQWKKAYPKTVAQLKKQAKAEGTHEDDVTKLIKRFYMWRRKMDKDFLDGEGKFSNALGKQYDKEEEMAKAHADAMKAALQAKNDAVKQAVDNLMNIYDELRQQNEAAFGGFGQGPVMGGILGGIFTGLNDLLRQFGVQIPIPFEIIRQDFDMQMAYFKRWRADLDELVKRGAPPVMIEQLQAMGPEQGIPLVEGLLGKKGKPFQRLISDWKGVQKDLDKATQTDLDRKLKYWRSYGEKAAWAMINGVISSPDRLVLQKKFENYIRTNFANSLAKVFADAFKEAMDSAVAAMPTATPNLLKPTPAQIAAANLFKATQAYKTARKALQQSIQVRPAEGRSEAAQARTARLQTRVTTLQRQVDVQRRAYNIATIQPQIVAGREKVGPGKAGMTVIHYHGDSFKVSTELTAAQFLRLSKNRKWRVRHKVKGS